jgi:hypothetical protein
MYPYIFYFALVLLICHYGYISLEGVFSFILKFLVILSGCYGFIPFAVSVLIEVLFEAILRFKPCV